MKELRFNVGWNIWREVAEIGVFLIPFFLEGGAVAIPVSALVGTIAGIFPAALVYWANKHTKNQGMYIYNIYIILYIYIQNCVHIVAMHIIDAH